MKTTRYVLFAALGVAAILLLTTDKGKEIREDLGEKAKDNAKKWKESLAKIGNAASDTVSDLKDMLASEASGLSDSARERIEAIVDKSAKSSKKFGKKVSNQMS